MVNLTKLKLAIEAIETNSGANSYPRFEVSYAPGGHAFTVQGHILHGTGGNWNGIVAVRWNKWGMASACSYGKAQILYHTAADLEFAQHPAKLWVDEDVHDFYVAKKLLSIERQGALTVEQFADSWNSGNFHDGIIPHEYIAKVVAAYAAQG